MTSQNNTEFDTSGGNLGKSSIEPSDESTAGGRTPTAEQQQKDGEYKLYGYRHFELALYSLASMCNQITWISLQPVAGAIQNGYGYGSAAISFIGITYMIVFIIANYPSSQVIDKYGLRIAVLIGMAFTTLGMAVKCAVNVSFVFIIVGQVIAACGQPLLAIAPAKLATQWFGQNERVIATTIATAAQPLGVAIGFVFPSLFVTATDADEGASNEDSARHHIFLSQVWQAGIGAFVMLLLIFLFREKPKTPPSATSGTELTENVMENTKALFKDPNFRKLMMTFGIIFGTVNTYGTIVGILANKMGYSDDNASIFGAVFIIGGIVGSAILGTYVEVTRKYKVAMMIVAIIAIFGPIALLSTLYTGYVWPVCLAAFLLGFDLAILPVGIDFGVEMTYPIAEPVSTGLLMSTAQFFGIIMTVSCTALVAELEKPGCLYSQIALIVMAAIGLFFSIIVKEDLKRLKYEKSLAQSNEQDDQKPLL